MELIKGVILEMKSILISIKPKYVAEILNGNKTIEIRKTMPKCDLPIDVYIYCTKEEYLYRTNKGYFSFNKPLQVGKGTKHPFVYSDESKVVAKFTLNKVEEIKSNLAMRFFTDSFNEKELLDKSCLSGDELFWYLAPQELKVKSCGYAWHISNLLIFDEPKELSEFYKCQYIECTTLFDRESRFRPYLEITKAPQSYCYVEAKE